MLTTISESAIFMQESWTPGCCFRNLEAIWRIWHAGPLQKIKDYKDSRRFFYLIKSLLYQHDMNFSFNAHTSRYFCINAHVIMLSFDRLCSSLQQRPFRCHRFSNVYLYWWNIKITFLVVYLIGEIKSNWQFIKIIINKLLTRGRNDSLILMPPKWIFFLIIVKHFFFSQHGWC